ncbi:MAG: translation initiation factor IF-2 N-terminal domain-containing protein [Oscillospiraceae bacterium]|nr:translation initiation factor IF-2 N-terminal domain-containing protein [Oscillospiraceae bacterium]
MMIKYRVHEVAKDLNVPSKDVIELLGKHFDTPKKHMTALTEEELNVVFEHFTQKAQVENFDRYFASANKEAPKAKEPVKKQEAPAEKKAAPAQEKKPQNEKPQKPAAAQQKPAQPAAPSERSSTGTRGSHVDMRSSQVNLDKYNEKYDNIATSSMGNRDTGAKKQKLTQKSAQRGKPQFLDDRKYQQSLRLPMERPAEVLSI